RDRDQLPADEPVPDPDDDEEVQRTVLLRGDRVAAAEPVGMAASRRPVDPAAGVPAVQLGAAAGGADAAVAGACGRGLIWSGPHGSDRKIYTSVGCDLTPRDRSLGKYWVYMAVERAAGGAADSVEPLSRVIEPRD